ncbi:MAG: hypothetical protein ACLQVD_13835 [Capsulimonadaceae bacterium]
MPVPTQDKEPEVLDAYLRFPKDQWETNLIGADRPAFGSCRAPRPPGQVSTVTDEALRRENLYEDRGA